MPLESVLLIDPDPQGLATMTFGFAREGHRVEGAADYADGARRAAAERFDVVVLTLRPGPEGCREVLENLAERDGQPMPIVALGDEEHRRLVEAMPAADFLPMPAFIRDILTTAKLRAGIARSGEREPVLRGTLSEFGVLSLLRSLQATRRSAIVALDRAGRRGELRFARGELTWAAVGSQQGVSALNQLLLWEEAALEVQLRDVIARRSQFSHKGPELVAEIERFLRDFVAAARPLGNARTLLAATPAAASASEEVVPAELAPVLRLCDGQRTLAEVIDESPFRVFDTLKVVQRFLDHGLLMAAGEPPAAPGGGVRSPVLEDWLRPRATEEYVQAAASDGAAAPRTERVRLPTPPPLAASEARAARRAQRKSTQRMKTLRAQAGEQASAGAPGRPKAPAPASSLEGPTQPEPRPAALEPTPAPVSPAPDPRRRTRTGEIRVGGEVQARAQRDRSVSARPSIVIDLPVAPEGAATTVTATEPASPASPSAASMPAAVPPDRAAERKRQETPAFGMPAPRRERPVLKVAPRAAETPATPAAPPAPTQPVPPSASLTPEPYTPPPAQVMRATGSIEAARTPRRPVTPPPVTGGLGSIQLAPELLGEVPPPQAPARPPNAGATATTPRPDPAPASIHPTGAPAPPEPRVRAPSSAPHRARRPSNEFDAVERDFFAREADLYKQEPVEDFTDLDGSGRRRR